MSHLKRSNTKQIALLLDKNVRTIQRWKRQGYFPNGYENRKETRGRKTKLNDDVKDFLKTIIETDPQLTQVEMKNKIKYELGIDVNQSSICRWLKKLSITRKKVQWRATQALQPRVQQRIEDFLTLIRQMRSNWNRVYNIDECAWYLNHAPTMGYAPKGHRLVMRKSNQKIVRFCVLAQIRKTQFNGNL